MKNLTLASDIDEAGVSGEVQGTPKLNILKVSKPQQAVVKILLNVLSNYEVSDQQLGRIARALSANEYHVKDALAELSHFSMNDELGEPCDVLLDMVKDNPPLPGIFLNEFGVPQGIESLINNDDYDVILLAKGRYPEVFGDIDYTIVTLCHKETAAIKQVLCPGEISAYEFLLDKFHERVRNALHSHE